MYNKCCKRKDKKPQYLIEKDKSNETESSKSSSEEDEKIIKPIIIQKSLI